MKLIRLPNNFRALQLNGFLFIPMGGGYWTIEQDGETIENWATSDEVREYIADEVEL